jgi:hypothetical protein
MLTPLKQIEKEYEMLITKIDAPPGSLMDSMVSPKVETVDGEGVQMCSLAHNTLEVKGRPKALGWGLGKINK